MSVLAAIRREEKKVKKQLTKLQYHLHGLEHWAIRRTLAWENYRVRFDHAFGVESEGFTQGSYCALPVHSGSHA